MARGDRRPARATRRRVWAVSTAIVASALSLVAAQGPVPSDPRVGLTPGLRNAGVAARNLVLVANVPKPAGFFDPQDPLFADPAVPPPTGPRAGALSFANSDLAFAGQALILGNFNGFTVFSIEDPSRPQLRASVVCPGGQGDVSVHGTLLFMSVEETRGRLDCGTGGASGAVNPERFRGIRIFDVTDVRAPRQVGAVQTCRGSHTHTLVVDPKDASHVFLYGSGSASVRSGDELAGCSGKTPQEDAETSLFSIDVIEVPVAAPARARIVNRPRIFGDPATGAIAGLWPGGNHGANTQTTSATNHCHDITAFPAVGLAAGACAGNGVLLDISDPVHPVRIDQVSDPNFAYWHSATFNHDGTKVIFTDEWGGGTQPRCRSTDRFTWGADAIFDIVHRKLRFGSYYKLPAVQTEVENCVAHNGSIVPVPGRDIMVQGWYQGGVSVFDFTDSEHPFEIAYFDRGPIDPARVVVGGHWSAYWYNGYIYGSEIVRGLDVFALAPSDLISRHEIEAASLVRVPVLNAQQQQVIVWPRAAVVGRAYVDQLRRDGLLPLARLQRVGTLLDRLDFAAQEGRPTDEALRLSAATLARELRQEAAQASPQDAARLRGLADVVAGADPAAAVTVGVPVENRQLLR